MHVQFVQRMHLKIWIFCVDTQRILYLFILKGIGLKLRAIKPTFNPYLIINCVELFARFFKAYRPLILVSVIFESVQPTIEVQQRYFFIKATFGSNNFLFDLFDNLDLGRESLCFFEIADTFVKFCLIYELNSALGGFLYKFRAIEIFTNVLIHI